MATTSEFQFCRFAGTEVLHIAQILSSPLLAPEIEKFGVTMRNYLKISHATNLSK